MRQRVLISSILGFLGTLCVSILSFVLCRPGQSCVPIHGLVWDSLSLLVALTGLALTVIAWFLVRECRLRQQWMIFAIWILPLLFAPPVLSHDAWAYAEQG